MSDGAGVGRSVGAAVAKRQRAPVPIALPFHGFHENAMTRRFEVANETSSKFWEITVADATVMVSYGRVGTAGETQAKSHGSAAAATSFAAAAIAMKVQQGYLEVRTAAPPAHADAAVDQQVAEIRKLLGQADAAAVWQGIALLRALDNPALWAMLAEGASVDAEGEVHTPSGSEIHKWVRATPDEEWGGTPRFRASVAIWALTSSGRLRDTRELLLRGYAFEGLAGLQGLDALTSLDLSGSASLTDLTGLGNLPALTSLDLSNNDSLTDLTGLGNLPALTSLNLPRCESLTDLTGLRDLPALSHLDLSECALTDLTGLQNLPALTSLVLSGNASLTDLTGFGNLPALTSLDLSSCASLTDLTGLGSLPALTSLTLRYCDSLTDWTGLGNLPALTSLDLHGCESLKNPVALQNLPALTCLTLSKCASLTDLTGLRELPALNDLDLKECKSLTDLTGLQNLPELRYLDLYGCESLKNLAALQNLPALTQVNLDDCKSIPKVHRKSLEGTALDAFLSELRTAGVSPKKKPAAKGAVAKVDTSGAIRLEFHGSGGEYLLARMTPDEEKEARELAAEGESRELFDMYDDLLHTHAVDLDDCTIKCIDRRGKRKLDLSDIERERALVDGHEMPPPGLRFLIGFMYDKGFFGHVDLITDGAFDPKKLVLRYVDLEEWGGEGNPLRGIVYDGTAYAIDQEDNNTSGPSNPIVSIVQYGKQEIESIDEIGADDD
ncbi:MAG: leucine-rich repeat domain-containing protein [Gemmatimonadota bacterium]|nr:leucine-rich repeat domain-containing protein [Gemmatimonadota bacterium]MDQ8168749.1 leucine-rich repeat domain-containing protein [Gemmatimonadota bacterium]MDQ8172924.1 leucine-rich repeat domain-containing protein [Gemmatimonadota bacterium]